MRGACADVGGSGTRVTGLWADTLVARLWSFVILPPTGAHNFCVCESIVHGAASYRVAALSNTPTLRIIHRGRGCRGGRGHAVILE